MQKSGYFARAAPANAEDLELINKSCEVAVAMACLRVPGVVGMDEDKARRPAPPSAHACAPCPRPLGTAGPLRSSPLARRPRAYRLHMHARP